MGSVAYLRVELIGGRVLLVVLVVLLVEPGVLLVLLVDLILMLLATIASSLQSALVVALHLRRSVATLLVSVLMKTSVTNVSYS